MVRAVDEYQVRPWGLYMARPTPGRAQFHYLQSWLLPTFGLRASIFHWNPGHERDQDFYLDVCEIDVAGNMWRTVDLYLDLVVRTGRGTEVVDLDELLEAVRASLVSEQAAEGALRTAFTAVAGLTEHSHDLTEWMQSNAIELLWR